MLIGVARLADDAIAANWIKTLLETYIITRNRYVCTLWWPWEAVVVQYSHRTFQQQTVYSDDTDSEGWTLFPGSLSRQNAGLSGHHSHPPFAVTHQCIDTEPSGERNPDTRLERDDNIVYLRLRDCTCICDWSRCVQNVGWASRPPTGGLIRHCRNLPQIL